MTQETLTNDTSNKGANLEGASIVLPLKAFEKDPDAGFRLSRHIAKKDKDGNYNGLQTSKGVIVPANLALADAIKLPALRAVLTECLEGAQDRLIRSLLEQGKEQIQHAAIALECVEKYLAEQPETFGRLSAEKIATWFDEECADVVILRVSLKLFNVEPVNLNEAQRAQVVKLAETTMKLFQRAAERSPQWEEGIKVKLLAILDDCAASPMVEKLRAIIEKKAEEFANLADAL